MKKWKIIKSVSILLLIVLVITLIIRINVEINVSKNMTYPQLILGMEAYNWKDRFCFSLFFILAELAIPITIAVILLVVSYLKIKKVKKL